MNSVPKSVYSEIDTHPGASDEAIQFHYDLSNDFFSLWLGESMSYTSALWAPEDTDLDVAQNRKVDYHCQQVNVRGAKRVLDVGCGWGGLAKRLVEDYDVEKVVGLTLSQEQADWIAKFNKGNIEVLLENWSSHQPSELYDRVFAWGVMEHAARPALSDAEKVQAYRAFLEQCHKWLKPGGWLSVQTITYENSRRSDLNQFILEKIFPESDLPCLADLAHGCEMLFEVRTLVNHREHYVKTLSAWRNNLRKNRKQAIELVGETIVADYEKYLSLFIIGFHTGTMNLARLSLQRIDNPRL